MDYLKLNQVVTPIAAAEPGVVSLLEQINTSPGPCFAALDLANALFSTPSLRPTSSGLLLPSGVSNTPLLSYPSVEGYVNSPALSHRLVLRDLDHFPFHKLSYWSISLVIMLVGPTEREGAPTPDLQEDNCMSEGRK